MLDPPYFMEKHFDLRSGLVSVQALSSQPGQGLLDVSSVLANGLQSAADVLVYVMAAMVSSPDRKLHYGGLQGELVLVDAFEHIGEGVGRRH